MEILKTSQLLTKSDSHLQSKNAATVAESEYAKILAEKIANARTTMEQMNEIQAQLDYNRELHKELTGKAPSEDSDESSEDTVQTIRRFMPDGSIMTMTVRNGEIVEQNKKKPRLVAVADPSAPKTASGQTAVTMKMKPQLDLFSLI